MNRAQLMKIKAEAEGRPDHFQMEWQAIGTAPFGRDLELAVIDANEVHTLVFPCRRVFHGWAKAKTDSLVNVHPTHWREWDDSVSPLFSRSAS
jgi:hypothetical protein